MSLTDRIIEYEQGGLGALEIEALFQELVDTGLAWQLQGTYERTAMRLLEAGVIHPPIDYANEF